MLVSQTIAGLTLGSIVKAPMPFDGTAEIIGFRYHTHHMTGRTSVVADYLVTSHEGKIVQSFDSVDRVIAAQTKAA
jgi:hypothetical protein